MKKWINYFIVAQMASALVSCGSPSVTMPPNPLAGVKSSAPNNKAQDIGVDDNMKVEDLPQGTVIKLIKPMTLQGGNFLSKAGVVILNGQQIPIQHSDSDVPSCTLLPPDGMLNYDGASVTIKAGYAFKVTGNGRTKTSLGTNAYRLDFNNMEFNYLFAIKDPLTASELLKLCFGDSAVYELPKN